MGRAWREAPVRPPRGPDPDAPSVAGRPSPVRLATRPSTDAGPRAASAQPPADAALLAALDALSSADRQCAAAAHRRCPPCRPALDALSAAGQLIGMAALTSIGQSDSQNASRNNVRRIYTLFAQSTDTPDKFKKYPEFHNLPEQLACSTDLYEQFSHFLVHVYKIEQRGPNCGQPLMFSSVLDYLGILVNMAADTYLATGTNDTKLFFTCLDINSTTRAAKWPPARSRPPMLPSLLPSTPCLVQTASVQQPPTDVALPADLPSTPCLLPVRASKFAVHARCARLAAPRPSRLAMPTPQLRWGRLAAPPPLIRLR
eukprot:jgi/Tetstr1/461205/TSEL_006342.t1